MKIAISEFSPTAKLSAESTKSNDLSSTVDEREQEELKATLKWPLFKGGKNLSSVKKAKFKDIPKNMIPDTESLKDTFERVVPYYEKNILPLINENIIIAAHGNSVRALCKYLFNINNEKISKLEIPTGNPLLIKFDNNKKVKDATYLDKNRANDLIIFN